MISQQRIKCQKEVNRIIELRKIREKLNEIATWTKVQDGSIKKLIHHSDFSLVLSTLGYDYGNEIMDSVLTSSTIIENGFIDYSALSTEIHICENIIQTKYGAYFDIQFSSSCNSSLIKTK